MAKINSIDNKGGSITIDPGSGDSFTQFSINGTGKYRMGVDDDDSDKFKVASGSALGTTDFFIMTSDGERTMPLQPAVLVEMSTTYNNVTGDGSTWTVQFNQEIFDQNSDFNTGTYTFTAPVTARYFVEASVQPQFLTSSHTSSTFECVTSNRTYLLSYVNPYSIVRAAVSNPITLKGCCFVDMDQSDTLTIKLTISGGTKVVDVPSSTTRTRLGIYMVS